MNIEKKGCLIPQRWGITVEKIKPLEPKLREHWQPFRQHFKTKTRDTAEFAPKIQN